MYFLGCDIGSSSVKVSLVESQTRRSVAFYQSDESEMSIQALQPGWAEQDPEVWWRLTCKGIRKVLVESQVNPQNIGGIGITYQMHGLVLTNRENQVLRPAIIWCDGRAAHIGQDAFVQVGSQVCFNHVLNSPGNFTAAKLKWVQLNEPHIYEVIDKVLLPGDFIAMKLSDEKYTSISGLSEMVLFDFSSNQPAYFLMDALGFQSTLFPKVLPSCSLQGMVSNRAAQETGLKEGTCIYYRAGDQPNNALSLNVLNPGEVAATGGTSGVIYSVTDQRVHDQKSRVNGFAHVNYHVENPRIGMLMCINGAGRQYAWLKQNFTHQNFGYNDMEREAGEAPIGSDSLSILPFGNGAERILENRNVSAHILGLELNRHTRGHIYRAALEGVAFAFAYGAELTSEMGLRSRVMRAGNDNLFRSKIFGDTLSSLIQAEIEVYDTTGAVGAAKAAGVVAGAFSSLEEAMAGQKKIGVFNPQRDPTPYLEAYARWKKHLMRNLEAFN